MAVNFEHIFIFRNISKKASSNLDGNI